MLLNWSSNQQYFGALILTWDSAFAELIPPPPVPGKYLQRNIFMAGRKRLAFESEERRQYFISKEKIKR
jgi:hypothetical protein